MFTIHIGNFLTLRNLHSQSVAIFISFTGGPTIPHFSINNKILQFFRDDQNRYFKFEHNIERYEFS